MLEIRPGQRIVMIPGDGLRVVQPRGAAEEWWEAGGAAGCVAAYQAKAAADYATSKVNLANPGTYDAYEGVAPSWDAVNGWKDFSVLSAYLSTGIVPVSGYTVLIRFIDASTNDENLYLFGMLYYYITPRRQLGVGTKFSNGGVYALSDSGTVSGILGMAGHTAYKNGVSVGTIPAGPSPSNVLEIGRYNPIGLQTKAKIQAFALWSRTLSAAEVSTYTAAMAALS